MTLFTIDQERCNRDGVCAAECPSRIIEMASPDGYPRPVPDAGQYCLGCGHCVAVCPNEALSLRWLAPGDCPPVHREKSFTASDAEHFLRYRRSIRSFKIQPVEREKLDKLLEIACYAPSAKNQQPWHWIVIVDTKEVRRLACLVVDWMRDVILTDPELADRFGLVRVVAAWDGGEERICRGAPHIIVAHADRDWPFGPEDCALALDYLELFAPTLGLGTCWGGYFYTAVNRYPPLSGALGLPDHHRAYGAMMVGYPEFTYRRFPERNPPRVTWR
ncbi:MAG: nitroreductase family protein [Thermodesulfobacteriota bacterium]|nr:nitroreductase family protein [Thermodesulfobacteriota bacterium]